MPVTEISLNDLRRAASALNESGTLTKLGSCDARFGVCAGRRRYAVTFDAFECTSVDAIRKSELEELDFAIDMPAEAWAKYLRALGTKREKTLAELDADEAIVKGDNPLQRLNFARYHRTYDALFRELR